MMAFLTPIQEKYNQISDSEISDMLAKNLEEVRELSEKKMKQVYKTI
jgi:hypothetical protein